MSNDFLVGSIGEVKDDETQSITADLSEVESMSGQLTSSTELIGSIQMDDNCNETSLIGSVFDEDALSGEIDDASSLDGDIDPSEMELFGEIHDPKVIDDYNALRNLPTIEGITVRGDLTSDDLGLQKKMSEISTTEIIKIWNEIMNE